MPVHLTAEFSGPRGFRTALVKTYAQRMLDTLQLKDAELSILLTSDDQIHILNRDYRKKDRPTDVLAFAMREGKHGELAGDVLGDVVISLQTAARQAPEQGRSMQEEVTFLLAHGLLHLLGWDHDTDAKDRAMRRETERLCRAAEGVRAVPRRTTKPARGTTKVKAKNPAKRSKITRRR